MKAGHRYRPNSCSACFCFRCSTTSARCAAGWRGGQWSGADRHDAAHLAESRGIAAAHIEPGKPQQNAYIERYNRTVWQEWLGQYQFADIKEVQDTATEWLWTYNHERPSMALGGITPKQKLMQQMEVKRAA
jgi:transposase InsO family protein